ncbi:HlyD family efflux transporter periplasmic adaptor subunit [Bacillus thuringiensis]|nr:HlyD family efflux transporter periplasmic adaptor subunit [Bacillus thuringiensis]
MKMKKKHLNQSRRLFIVSNIIIDIDELTDSREVMDSKPRSFTIIFIYIIIFLLFAFLIWAYFGKIETVTKLNGVVRPDKEVSIISSKNTGKIKDINIEEGKKVKAGEVLFTIEHDDLNIQKQNYEHQLEEKNKHVDNLKKLKNAIKDNKNPFSNTPAEEYYYNRFLKNQSDYNDQKQQSNLSKGQIQVQIETTKAQIKTANETLDNLKNLKRSVNDNVNYLPKDSSYYVQFVDYQMNVNNIQSKDELDKFKNQFLTKLMSTIEENQNKVNELKAVVESNNQLLGKMSDTNDNSSLSKYSKTELNQIDTEIQLANEKINELNFNLNNLNASIDGYIIKAPIKGIVSIDTPINKDDLIQPGAHIATIIPEDNSQYRIELAISDKDINSIKEGKEIKYHFPSIPYREYGELKGKVTKIGIDSKQDPKSGASFYKAYASMENKLLYNQKGKKAEVKVGMICEGLIVTKQVTVLNYLIDKITK